jgi:hypothetical protein
MVVLASNNSLLNRILSAVLVACLILILCRGSKSLSSEGGKDKTREAATCKVIPLPYDRALKNPLMGFTTRGIYDHPWASTAQTYIKWNEIENNESDGIDKIKKFCDSLWLGVEEKNIKVVPRVYLHWSADRKFWPADMATDDYTSDQFKKRVVRLVKRLGECWDNDSRVAFVEMGIFGLWGEQHSPLPTQEMQQIVGDAFAKAFKNKKVSVRHNWRAFLGHPFGVYWDSWAHYDQMWSHGDSIRLLNDKGRYLENYVGGEVAYGWGNASVQPGPSPTASVAEEKHRNFIINTLRWLHCTQVRWIENYDQKNEAAVKGAEEIQRAFGYRFVLNEVRFSFAKALNVAFDVTNTGSAPFYYNWPVEVALLDAKTHQPVWKSTFKNTDIRKWLPGDGWTAPDWTASPKWAKYLPDTNWNATGKGYWKKPAQKTTVNGSFKVDIADGNYILSLSILDPAGNLPSVRFATANYLSGALHPIGMVDTKNKECSPLQTGFNFSDPNSDIIIKYIK